MCYCIATMAEIKCRLHCSFTANVVGIKFYHLKPKTFAFHVRKQTQEFFLNLLSGVCTPFAAVESPNFFHCGTFPKVEDDGDSLHG